MNFEKTKPKIFTHGSHQDEFNMNSIMASKKNAVQRIFKYVTKHFIKTTSLDAVLLSQICFILG